MDDRIALAERFEEDRRHLKAVAYRMLGSASEADDAVQESWLRASQADVSEVRNLTGWLTTVVGRVCLNMLRSRRTRHEEPLDRYDRAPESGEGQDPEQEALLADSVGLALLVVLDRLAPAERLAFVLHDMFAVPFAEIGPLLDRSPDTARQLASRARRRVKGGTVSADPEPSRRRQVVEAFLSASRAGDFEALVALLHPDVVLHADPSVIPTPEPVVVRGAHTVAKGAMAATGRALFTGVALVDGRAALAMAPHGRLRLVLGFTLVDGLITVIDVVADPDRIARLDIGVLDD
ncbi:sigma-70 family RNA polymerase sigma factor [Streptomyces sp. OR43]|uniref:sigma-70 family RNA polymerase sigma factor n=1 Tax=Streptomyces sp. or43 TaxID=2478957 RepID=UPI0011CD7D45|nr:sigma-70 family RNA polymerase sigma factor [Streptomyces sp. or43]TXS35662.1 sigma-70 family RNA polymerase sigma factor [Streptomyces sp. or43]